MAIANVLTIGTTSASSSDIVVANGATLSVGLKKTGGGVLNARSNVKIYRKDDLGGYNYIGRLNTSDPGYVLQEGTYRFTREANGASVGVFSG